MTYKQIIADGRFIPMEEAIKAGLVSEKDIDVLSKQIIIDGVDVADCEHINTCAKKIKCVILQDDVCEINPYCEGFNCYYKQLKRKEQECERLKGLCNGLDTTIDNYTNLIELRNQQLDQLKAENDELKKANIHIDNNRMVKDDKLKRIEDLIIACSSGYTDEFIQELLVILHEPEPCFKSKLSKTLTEIKEIAKNGCYDDCGMPLDELSIILQKISECEGNDGL